MPGIAGILSKGVPSPDESERLGTMLRTMHHEPFYVQSIHTNPDLGWYAGSVAIQGSFADNMPVCNETGEVVLFLAGECFSDHGTSPMLRGRSSDRAGYLVHLYEDHGPSFVRNLNGCFCGLLLDSGRRQALLFNDRYGMQRLYYHEDAHNFYFASESKALLKIIPTLKAIDPQSVAEYLCFDCVLNNRTYFTHIDLLPGGSAWLIEQGHARRTSYFNYDRLEEQSPLSAEQFRDGVIETFCHVLPRYLSGETVGITVTGGLDTRLILSCLPSNHHCYKTFTFGAMDRDSQDVRIARHLSAACELEHQTLRLGEDFIANFPSLAARAIYLSDGLASATNVESLYLNRLFRDVAPIKLTGKYGSQVLGRVRTALRLRIPDQRMIHDGFRQQVHAVSGSLKAFEGEHALTYILSREIPWYWVKYSAQEVSQLTVRSPFLDNDLIDVLYRAPREGYDGNALEREGIRRNKHCLLTIRTNQELNGSLSPVVSPLVNMVYRFLGVADKALHWDVLPHSLHHLVTITDTMILTPLRLNRIFYGFEYYHHYNQWFRRELASYLRDILLDERTLQRPYWDAQNLQRCIADHIQGRGRYLAEIRKVLTLELIHRLFLEDDDRTLLNLHLIKG